LGIYGIFSFGDNFWLYVRYCVIRGLIVNRDRFELIRANEARQWLNHPDRAIEAAKDKIIRAKIDKSLGHLPKCGLLKCHSDCKQYRG
jgi:hypothetical protein